MPTREARDDELFPDELADDAAAAADAYASNGNGHDLSEEPSPTARFELDPEITILELQCAPTAPPAIVENYLFEDVEAFIAPGGIGKTTLRLKEYVNIALGLPLWGQRVLRAGACVFVTAEDRREICVGRLREICNSMDLSQQQIAQVLTNIRIHDVSGKSFKLTFIDREVILQTSNVGAMIEALRPLAPVVVGFDPAMSFGVGESRVNDAEQGLIEAARRIRNELRCCVQITHHTGKQTARDGVIDQYAGRGGSALADGARMVHVLQPMEPEKWIEETGAPLNDGEQGIRLSRPKQSYTPRDQSFDLFIVRNGYAFHEVPAKQKPRSNQAAVLAANAEDDRAALRVIIADHAAGKFTSKAYLENALGDRSSGVELSRSRIRYALARLERDGKVEVRQRVPKQAGSNAFLAPTSVALVGGDHS
jgi:RecA-family ATPase